jgi:3-hydroxybenzoate 6-monooxygenase
MNQGCYCAHIWFTFFKVSGITVFTDKVQFAFECFTTRQGVMNQSRIPFLVIGGGIGGLTTALALSRKGYPVHLIERAAEFGEIGAGIQIAPNGSRMLDSLGVLDKIQTYAVYPHRLILVDALSGDLLTTLDFGEKFQRAYTYPYLVMHRSDLLTILLDACRQSDAITLETNRKVVAVDDLTVIC